MAHGMVALTPTRPRGNGKGMAHDMRQGHSEHKRNRNEISTRRQGKTSKDIRIVIYYYIYIYGYMVGGGVYMVGLVVTLYAQFFKTFL